MKRSQAALLLGLLIAGALLFWRRGETPAVPPTASAGGARVAAPDSTVRRPEVGRPLSPVEKVPPSAPHPVEPPSSAAKGVPLLDAEQLEKAFDDLLSRNREAVLKYGYSSGSIFFADRIQLRREARLFAQAYPDLAEKLAIRASIDLKRDWRERHYAVDLLGFLAASGHSSALPALRAMISDDNEMIRSSALAGIGVSDADGANKALFWTQCRAGSATAFAFAALWPDASTISEMNSLMSTIYKDDAQDVLKKFDILSQSDWKDRLSQILKGQPSSVDDPVDWAVSYLRRRDPGFLKTLLRSELDAASERAQRWWAGQRLGEDFAKNYVSADDVSKSTGRKDYDLFLLTCWQIGGDLTPLERQRLRTFGYASDPPARLAELLSEAR